MGLYTGWDAYNHMHNPGSTASLDSAHEATTALQTSYANLADALTKSQSSMNNFWQGKGSDSAQTGLSPLINNSKDSAEKLGTSAESLRSLSVAFTETKNKMIPLGDRPTADGLFNTEFLDSGDYIHARDAWDAKAQQNVDAYQLYRTAAQEYTQSMPTNYPSVTDAAGQAATAPNSADPNVSTGGSHSSPQSSSSGMQQMPGGGNPANLAAYTRSTAGASTGTASSNLNSRPNPILSPQTTTPGGYQSAGRSSSSAGQSGNIGGSGGSSNDLSALGGFGPVGSGGGAAVGGYGGSGGGGAGAAKFGGAASGGTPGENALGSGKGSGAVAPGESAMARGGTAAAGVSGRGTTGPGSMMPGAGMGRGQGGGNETHDRKILLSDGEPDSLFGSDQLTAPPVIGE
jgi:hypothetical protein